MNEALLTDPFFVLREESRFTRDAIADLAWGRCAAVRVANFFSEARCAEVLAALEAIDFQSYDTERVYPPVMRFGVGVSDHRVDGALGPTYWSELAESAALWSALGLADDPLGECRAGLAREWAGGITVGSHQGRRLGAGVAREPNGGFQVHFDDVSREFTVRLLDANLVAQFAFNLYLSVPPHGGETAIWRHRWSPRDEEHRLPHSYGYAPDVIGDEEAIHLEFSVGDALLFNPSFFHAVRPSHGARRITLGFAVGMTDLGELQVWG